MDREYKIIIKNQTTEQKGAVAGVNASGIKSAVSGSSGQQSSQGGSATAMAIANVAFNQVKRMTVNEINYQVSTVQLRTGSSLQQQKLNFAIQQATEAVGFIAMTAVGIATANPLAIVSALMIPVNKALEIDRKQRTIDLQSSIENQSIQRQTVRAGTRGSRGGSYE